MKTPANSSEGVPAHSGTRAVIRLAAPGEAALVTNFLHEREFRPRPLEADLAELLGRSDAALFYALLDGRIGGTAGFARDAATAHLVYQAFDPPLVDTLAPLLLSAVENGARAQGAVLITASAPRASAHLTLLVARGFEIDWEEADASDDRIITIVELIKRL